MNNLLTNKISKVFKDNKAFVAFLTAGDPSMDKTEEFILALERAGADLVEIGIPFSDPIAEGPVIQEANERALSAGATTDKLFTMVKRIRQKTEMPLVFLTYINPIFVYGIERFFKACQESGINGVIVPDLPYEEKGEILGIATSYEVDVITLIAPTSKDRIQMLAKEATGFIYLVSSLGVTGVRSEIKTDLKTIIADIRQVSETPIAVGFGISTPEQAKAISGTADGVIVGSAIVKIIAEYGENAGEILFDYVKSMKQSLSV
ncbi:tryptophan synthase subunit alpha [Acetobacterium fimetarium]|uniref:Tryptophan synthase alpha chain n=1 Tax=Acetobacterium fimetarium TaxID=52691 RepID=A0ABR6WW80_9FIRM|nr:tryptophan synthase subunit alpha [Acetobacterium fimetarium]MBC3804758.1 tryptophan synthase subunit alpha [Acetobacterium fimetarium]